MDMEQYTIGKTAALCHISVDQLRNYDKIGLLSPQGRGENNYRYYTESQLEDILIIKQLKNIGIPLKMIAQFLKNRDLNTIRSTMEENMLSQRASLAECQRRYDSIVDSLLSLEQALAQAVLLKGQTVVQEDNFVIIPIAERPIISIRGKSKSYKTNHYLQRYIELQNMIEAQKVQTGRSWFIVYHDHYDCIFDQGEAALGDMEFFVNIKQSPPGNQSCRYFGGFLAACATYLGAYDDDRHKHTYERLSQWAKSLGYHSSGISYQELVIGRMTTSAASDFVTKIYLPLNVDRI